MFCSVISTVAVLSLVSTIAVNGAYIVWFSGVASDVDWYVNNALSCTIDIVSTFLPISSSVSESLSIS